MILPDVNVLVIAHRRELVGHDSVRAWLAETVNANRAYGLADLVLSGFSRIVTHPRIFASPMTIPQALSAVERLRERPNRVAIAPGPRHWSIFTRLCRATGARGNRVPDAYLAALAIESGSEWITADRDFARYPGLHWRHPLDPPSLAR